MGLGFRVYDLEFEVQGSGCKVRGFAGLIGGLAGLIGFDRELVGAPCAVSSNPKRVKGLYFISVPGAFPDPTSFQKRERDIPIVLFFPDWVRP